MRYMICLCNAYFQSGNIVVNATSQTLRITTILTRRYTWQAKWQNIAPDELDILDFVPLSKRIATDF